MKKGGFTLLELLATVLILGILSSLAISRAGYLYRKIDEGTTKGNLGGLRSATQIYYSDHDGIWPGSLTDLTKPLPNYSGNLTYVPAVPVVRTGRKEHAFNPDFALAKSARRAATHLFGASGVNPAKGGVPTGRGVRILPVCRTGRQFY